jgi:hypothetical protein
MKKSLLIVLALILSSIGFGQNTIPFRSQDKVNLIKSDFTSLRASFSFSGIEAYEMNNERGSFSTITMPNTVSGGNVGEPEIPVVNKLIAVPFGATPTIRVTNYSTTDYTLEELGIHKLSPRQPDLMKDEKPVFVYNEAAYQRRGLSSEPAVHASVNGTLRGVQIGQITIEPVSYDPLNNTLRVFNNIEVEVSFEGADAKATEDMLVKTYSPYFDVLYKQLFNGRAVLDLYDEHPELWKTPVKMLVIANRMFEDCIQDWVAWKTMKGIYVDVNYTDVIGTTSDAIKSFIQNKYAQDAPTFLMIMGDKDQVVPSTSSASNTSRVSDLYYSSVDGDEFVDMYHSRLSATSVAEMTAMLNKGMEYEQYTMPDPSYLNNTLLIAGEDSGWGVTVGRPTIWYATNYYYNAEHGFDNVYEFSHGTYTNCYSYLSSGVGFANYTAHGSQTSWAGPSFDVNNVASLTNAHKYFLAIGNCCQSGDWGYGTCFGEALTRAENKGAYAYIGSCPNTTWKNDYYFGVGPTNRADGTMPSYEETGLGIYDAIWMDDVYNTVNSILYVGLLAGNAAEALGYELHSQTLYYWQAYHVLGDGSIMPYRVQPTANTVSHLPIFPIGMNTYEVSADPGSYVAISKDGVLYGTALVDDSRTAIVDVTPITSSGDVTICVTAPQRIPYIQNVPAAALEGPYITVDSYTPNTAHVGDETDMSITFKNVGSDPTSGTTTVTLSNNGNNNVEILSTPKTFNTLAADATATVNGFRYRIAQGVADGTRISLGYTAVNGNDTWEGNIGIIAGEAKLEYQNMVWDGSFVPGETLNVTAKFKNTGHYQAINAVATMSTSSDYVTINTPSITVGNIAVDQEVSCEFSITIAANCPETAQLPVTFNLNANGGLTAQGTETLKNSCNVYFALVDSYGDGWNGNALTVSFDDGTPSQSLTMNSGSSANYTLEIGNGTHVTLTWTTGSYAYECSFTVSYEGDLLIYQSEGTPSSGTILEFDCNCAAASQTYNVTVASCNNLYGTVSGGGEFSYGESCTVTATPAEGYYFTGWTENGVVVSYQAVYTFNVINDHNFVANFAEGNVIGDGDITTNAYLPSYNFYKYTLSQQIYTPEELGSAGTITSIAFFNAGAEKTRTYDFYMTSTNKNSFSNTTDWVSIAESDKVFSGSVTMVANAWTFIVFSTPFEYDGTSNVVLTADDNTGSYTSSPHMTCNVFNTNVNQALYIYSDNNDYDPFSPSTSGNTATLSVKNQLMFTKVTESGPTIITQAQTLDLGWGWVSFYVDLDLQTLENALGENASTIKTIDGFVSYDEGGWYGNLNTLAVEKMYQIKTTNNIPLSVEAQQVVPEEHPINIAPGWNWIGYPCTTVNQVSTRLTNFPSHNEDILKTHNAVTTYIEGYGWWGSLEYLTPGEGYMYKSNATESSTLIFSSGAKDGDIHLSDMVNLHWKADASAFMNNANVIATVDGESFRASENLEIGAFVNGECRGSAKLMYLEPLDKYLAMMTIYGYNDEVVNFMVYDEGNTYPVEEQVVYLDDMVKGSVKEPFVLHAANNNALTIAPNPVEKEGGIRIELRKGADNATIDLIDVMGRVILNDRFATGETVHYLSTPKVAGVYTIRVTDQLGDSVYEKLIVR